MNIIRQALYTKIHKYLVIRTFSRRYHGQEVTILEKNTESHRTVKKSIIIPDWLRLKTIDLLIFYNYI